MADGNIMLRIGSTFNGEGLQKLQKGVQQANQHVQRGIGVSQQMAGAIAGLDTGASRATQAVGGLVQGFAQGGVVGAVFAGVTMAMSYKLKQMQEETERVKKETAELQEKLNKAFSENLASRISATISNAKALGSEFERVAKHAEQVAAAMAGLQSAQSQGGIIRLETEKLNATVGVYDEALRKSIEAAYDVQIAEAKLAKVEEDAAAKSDAAREAYLTNVRRMTTIDNQMLMLDERIALEKKNAAAIRSADEAKANDILKKVQELEKQKAELLEKRKDAEASSTALEISYQTANQQRINAVNESTLALNSLKEKQSQEAAAAEKAAEQKRMQEEADREYLKMKQEHAKIETDVRAELAAAMKKQSDAHTTAAEATRELAAAEKRLEQATAAYNANIAFNRTNESVQGHFENLGKGELAAGFAQVMKDIPAIGKEAGNIAARKAIAEGRAHTVAQADRIANEAAREARREAYKEGAALSVDAARRKRLEGMSEKAMSKADRDWLAKQKEIEAGNRRQAEDKKKAEAEVAAAKKKFEESQQAQIDAAKDIKQIKQKLDDLGLK